jgi:hypothetical protein
MRVRGVDYWVYVFEVPAGTQRVDVQRVGTDGVPVGPPLTATTAA